MRATQLTWIGSVISLDARTVTLKVPEDKLAEIQTLTLEMAGSNVVSIKNLRSYIGKVQNIASVIYVWRPFLAELWGALYNKNNPSGPCSVSGCTWTKQILPALAWILSFIQGQRGAVRRVFHIDTYLGRGRKVRIVTDASPWGYGAWISIDGVLLEYFSDAVSESDEKILGIKKGTCEGQQVWEAMCMLIALRVWAKYWQADRVILMVRNDNYTVLTMVATMKASGPALTAIAREMALDLGDALYAPDVIEHTPGVMNGTSDSLSRRMQPGHDYELPSVLLQAVEVQVPARVATWWRSRERFLCSLSPFRQ